MGTASFPHKILEHPYLLQGLFLVSLSMMVCVAVPIRDNKFQEKPVTG